MALTDDLISCWEMNEGSGTRIDAHGTNDLADNNTVGSATGKVGDAASFDHNNDEYLSIASNSSLTFGNINWTIACWFMINSTGKYHTLVSKSEPSNYEFLLDVRNTNNLFWNLMRASDGSNRLALTHSATLSSATWYFGVGWFDAAGDTGYLQLNNGTPESAAQTGDPESGAAQFQIGGRADASATFSLNGLMDQVCIWKRILTSDERTELYNSGAGLSYAAMLGGGGGDIRRHIIPAYMRMQ